MKKIIDDKFDEEITLSSPEMKVAYEVFQAGVGLLHKKNDPKITERPAFFELPNPHNNVSDYVEKANAIYCYGMSFILYHEFSHFELNHSSDGSLQEEEEADDNAFWAINMSVSKEVKKTAEIGILSALSALLFLDNTMRGDEVHPDGDIRIISIIKHIDLDYDHYNGLLTILFKMWVLHYEYDRGFPNIEGCESWRECLEIILDYLSEIKNRLVISKR